MLFVFLYLFFYGTNDNWTYFLRLFANPGLHFEAEADILKKWQQLL